LHSDRCFQPGRAVETARTLTCRTPGVASQMRPWGTGEKRETIMTSNDDNAADPPATAVDDNETTAGPANDATTVIPPDLAHTQARAYSAIVDYDDPEQGDTRLAPAWAPPASWGLAWGSAGILLVCGLVAALVIGVMVWVAMRKRADDAQAGAPWSPPAESTSAVTLPPPTQTSTTPPPPTVTYTAPASPPTTVTVQAQPPAPSRDDEFIERLEADKLVLHDRAQALAGAHWVCRQLAAGRSQADIVASSEPDKPTVDTPGNGGFCEHGRGLLLPAIFGPIREGLRR
jgi:hypothetical protein